MEIKENKNAVKLKRLVFHITEVMFL